MRFKQSLSKYHDRLKAKSNNMFVKNSNPDKRKKHDKKKMNIIITLIEIWIIERLNVTTRAVLIEYYYEIT